MSANTLAVPAREAWWRRLAQAVSALCGLGLVGILYESAQLEPEGKAALAIFLATLWFWLFTRIEPAYVAAVGAGSAALLGALSPAALWQSATADVIWLIAGMFVIAEAVERTGLGARVRDAALAGGRTTSGLFWRMSLALGVMTFLIPSTSARAALALPAVEAIFPERNDPRRRALALLIPAIVLVTTSASLTGAASHILANDLLHAETGERISYLQWALWGVPFAALIGAFSCFIVSRLWLTREQRRAAVAPANRERGARLSSRERRVIWVLAALVVAWLSAPLHGLSMSFAAIVAAAILVAPGIGIVAVRDVLSSLQWRFLLFAAGALAMGWALMESGAAAWASDTAWEALGAQDHAWPAIAAIALISMASHLLVTSHLARAAMITLPALALAKKAGLDPTVAVFLAIAGTNFCLTFPVSSKVMLLFSRDAFSVRGSDMIKLSIVIAPVYFALMLVVATFI